MCEHDSERIGHRSVFIPLLLLSLAYVAWEAFQTTQLVLEGRGLGTIRMDQQKPLENSKKLRASLDKLARETQLLAKRGNKGATLIIDELRQRGITINTDACVLLSIASDEFWPIRSRLYSEVVAPIRLTGFCARERC